MSKAKIGFLASTSLVMGNMIGSGIFLIPSSLALYGGIGLLGWGIAALISFFLAIIFGHLAQLYPKAAGGPYAYTKITFGKFPAYLVAWGYWVSIWCTNAAIAVALTGYLSVFFPAINKNPVNAVITALFFVWLFTWINSKSIKTLGFIQVITTLLKVIPIVLIGVFGIFYARWDTLFSANISGASALSAITAATTITFFAFLGMESATIPSNEIDQPGRTVKKATIAGTALTTLVYILSSVAVMGIMPAAALAQSSAPFADAAFTFWGDAAKYVVAGGAVIATMGALNGWIFLQGRIPMAAAQDQLFPKIFAKENTNGAPISGILISSLLISLLVLANYTSSLVKAFTFMMKLSTLSVITPYLFSVLVFALSALRKTHKNTKLHIILASVTFAALIWIIIGCGIKIVLWGSVLLLAGIPFYIGMKKSN